MLGVHPELRKYIIAEFTVSAAFALAGIVSLIYGVWGAVQWPFVIFGVSGILSGFLGIVVVPRWYRRSTRVVSALTPVDGNIRIEIESDADSASIYATVMDAGVTAPI